MGGGAIGRPRDGGILLGSGEDHDCEAWSEMRLVGWWATSPQEPSCQGVWELEFRTTHRVQSPRGEKCQALLHQLCQGRPVACSFLSESLGDRDGRPVWALLSRERVVRRQVSELGESLDEDLVVRFLVTMVEIRERQGTSLATQGINIPNAGAPGIDGFFFQCLNG